ncbi:mitochondrial carrier protein, putative [Bodo saltans]|uniref:Mitochondrial carrier protein, putative n=1 Tax=Bodo saltans TaxID=75058 RepID=A0A0S4JF45_BODSA|nr:mitochondrial carrier protein, putative [Bodo saltans]|eukprot:CUG88790.1 mitochondrial carrier protein, putative [Bodo saltans]
MTESELSTACRIVSSAPSQHSSTSHGGHHHELSTNAVTRSLDDLHLPTWFGLQAATVGLRTAIMHPLSMAASRKRVSDSKDASIRSVLRDAYRGGGRGNGDVGAPAQNAGRGFRNMYRGFGVAATGNIFGEIAALWVVEAAKQKILLWNGCDPHNTKENSSAHYASAIAGMCGDLASIVLTTPLSIVCDRQLTAQYGMASGNRYENSLQTFKTVYRGSAAPGSRVTVGKGFGNLYAGAPASLAMLPAAGVWWTSYTEAKVQLYRHCGPWFAQSHETKKGPGLNVPFPSPTESPTHEHSGVLALADTNWLRSSTDNPIINGVAGVIASGLTTFIFTPLAVVRTRLQISTPDPNSKQFRITQVIRKLFREEGIRGFYRGTLTNISIAVLDGWAFSTLYEINKLGSDRGLRDG